MSLHFFSAKNKLSKITWKKVTQFNLLVVKLLDISWKICLSQMIKDANNS